MNSIEINSFELGGISIPPCLLNTLRQITLDVF